MYINCTSDLLLAYCVVATRTGPTVLELGAWGPMFRYCGSSGYRTDRCSTKPERTRRTHTLLSSGELTSVPFISPRPFPSASILWWRITYIYLGPSSFIILYHGHLQQDRYHWDLNWSGGAEQACCLCDGVKSRTPQQPLSKGRGVGGGPSADYSSGCL